MLTALRRLLTGHLLAISTLTATLTAATFVVALSPAQAVERGGVSSMVVQSAGLTSAAPAADRFGSLFYRAGDGVAVTGTVNGAGGFATLQTVGGFSTGWTHVVPVGGGRLLFYRAGDGIAATGRVDARGMYVGLRGLGALSSGWTHIVPVGGGRCF